MDRGSKTLQNGPGVLLPGVNYEVYATDLEKSRPGHVEGGHTRI